MRPQGHLSAPVFILIGFAASAALNFFSPSAPPCTSKAAPSELATLTRRAPAVDVELLPPGQRSSARDFGWVGEVAMKIVAGTSAVELDFAIVGKKENVQYEGIMLRTMLKRFAARREKPAPIERDHLSDFGAATPPATLVDVVLVPRCADAPAVDHLRKLVKCGECSDGDVAEKIVALAAKQQQKVVLVPQGMLNEALVHLQEVTGLSDADTMYWFQKNANQHQVTLHNASTTATCTPNKVHVLAQQALAPADASARRRVANFAKLNDAVDIYCFGSSKTSNCEALKNPGGRAEPRNALHAAGYTCPESTEQPPSPKGNMSLGVDRLSNAMWPRCKSYAHGCPLDKGIVFVKTLKTASSTMEGLLRRICLSRRLKCFIHHGKLLNYAYPEQRSLIEVPYSHTPAWSAPYDMFIAHTMNSPELSAMVVPSSGGKVLSILRKPVSRFRSHWHFWRKPDQRVAPETAYRWKTTEFAEFCPEVIKDAALEEELNEVPITVRLAVNGMARQMLACESCGSRAERQRKLDALIAEVRAPDSKYLLLLVERLPESLVLFKRDYGLETSDVLYLTKNAGGNYKNKDKDGDNELTRCLKKLNWMDEELYAAALEAHDRRVATLGDAFQREVAELVQLQSTINVNCGKCKKNSTDQECTLCIQEDLWSLEKNLGAHFKQCVPYF
eukprot:TRINITY_DN27697_c0_g1_i1.p1 TRINITY_DN27697_c0_g1~~TRINITY_DN27697_c0_g1_i1.p1  ORF type:complete len:675 (+),score=146.77 TRINITY_DN27697_c0_g1_i1:99-2123(+)